VPYLYFIETIFESVPIIYRMTKLEYTKRRCIDFVIEFVLLVPF